MVSSSNLFSELAQGKLFQIYLLLGEDNGAKDQFISLLKRTFFKGKEPGTQDITVFHGDEATVEAVAENLSTYSFFSEGKLVIVRDFEKLGNLKLLLECIELLPGSAVLILLSDKKTSQKEIERAIEKKGKSAVFWPMFENEGERWLTRKLGELGIKADREALRYIVEVTGTSVNELTNQIECIANYLEAGERLTEERARSIISALYAYTVFDLCNALFVEPAGELVRIFRYLVSNGEDLLKIEYFIGREIGKIHKAYAQLKSGADFGRIVDVLGLRKKESERIHAVISRVDAAVIRNVYAALNALDQSIKSSPKEMCLFQFERLLARMGRPKIARGH